MMPHSLTRFPSGLASLRRQARREALVHAGLLAVGGLALGLGTSPAAALFWLLTAAALAAGIHVRLRALLSSNHAPAGGPLRDRLGAANRLTLGRGLLIAAVAGFLPAPPTQGAARWIPGLLYLAAAAGDALDGYWARRRGEESLLGRRLDVELDALGLLAAPAVAVALGRLPPVYLLVGAAYYLYRGGLAWRRWRGLPAAEAPARPLARTTAGFHMGFVGLALLPVLDPGVLKVTAVLLMLPLLLGFGWDWLRAVGRLEEPAAGRWARRFAGAAEMGPTLLRALLIYEGLREAVGLWQAGLPTAALGWGLGSALVVAGVWSRVAAVVAWLVAAAVAGPAAPPPSLAALTALAAVGLLGPGRLSLGAALRPPRKRCAGGSIP
jgi:CDP-diacylglycerol--glycerol-3-phosphate 3-phosphatidyltransferase